MLGLHVAVDDGYVLYIHVFYYSSRIYLKRKTSVKPIVDNEGNCTLNKHKAQHPFWISINEIFAMNMSKMFSYHI